MFMPTQKCYEEYCIANLLQCNHNYIIHDDNGDIYKNTSAFLTNAGYTVHVFDINNHETGMAYNPLRAIQRYSNTDEGIMQWLELLMQYQEMAGWRKSLSQIDKEVSKLLWYIAIKYVYSLPPEQQSIQTLLETAIDIAEHSKERKYQYVYNLIQHLSNPVHSYYQQYLELCTCPNNFIHSVSNLYSEIAVFTACQTTGNSQSVDSVCDEFRKGKHAIFVVTKINASGELSDPVGMSLYEHLLQILSQSSAEHPFFITTPYYSIALKNILQAKPSHLAIHFIYHRQFHWTQRKIAQIIDLCDVLCYYGGKEYEMLIYLNAQVLQITEQWRASSRDATKCVDCQRLLTPDELSCIAQDCCWIAIRQGSFFYDKQYDITKHPNYKCWKELTSKHSSGII
jgi:hypothetical protein